MFTFVLLMAKIMELTDLVVSRGVGLDVVGRLLMYTMPYFLVFTIPMATLLGVLIAFLRLSSDNEIVALKAAGVSLVRLLPPVAALALFSWAGHQRPGPVGPALGQQQRFENLVYQGGFPARPSWPSRKAPLSTPSPTWSSTSTSCPAAGCSRTCSSWTSAIPKKQHTIVAKRGKFFPAKGGKLTLRLYDGGIYAVSQDKPLGPDRGLRDL